MRENNGLQKNFYHPDMVVWGIDDEAGDFLSRHLSAVAVLDASESGYVLRNAELFQKWVTAEVGEATEARTANDLRAIMQNDIQTLNARGIMMEITQTGRALWDYKAFQLSKSHAAVKYAFQTNLQCPPPTEFCHCLAFNSDKADFADAVASMTSTLCRIQGVDTIFCIYTPFRNVYTEIYSLGSRMTSFIEDTSKQFASLKEESVKQREETSKQREETSKHREETSKQFAFLKEESVKQGKETSKQFEELKKMVSALMK
jgi:hypothetical protein